MIRSPFSFLIAGLFLSSNLFAMESKFPEVDQARASLYGSTKGVTCPVKVVPGKSLGQIRLGATMEDLKRTGLEIKKVKDVSDLYLVGPYSIGFSTKVYRVEAEIGDLPNCVRYGKRKIPRNSDLAQLEKIFPSCHAGEVTKGGNLTSCTGISLGTGGWGGTQKTPSLRIP